MRAGRIQEWDRVGLLHGTSKFETAWHELSATKTEADYQAWRDQRDFTARKYAKRTRGEKLDSEIPSWLMRCACGVRFDSHVHAMTLIRAPHIYAAQAEKRRRG